MAPAPRHIAIVGGGTAGWLAALVLRKSASHLRISVIESPDIPTVGVGEGSTALFRQVLLELGISEADFVCQSGATFKFGIHHQGWRADGGDYFGPIDDPNALVPPPLGGNIPGGGTRSGHGVVGNWLHQAQIGSGKPLADAHLFTRLMRAGKSPYARKASGDLIALSPFHYAFHFDQARLGAFLATQAAGIDHIRAEVAAPVRDSETGAITALQMVDGTRLPVDLVVDCTGFRRAVIGQMGAPGAGAGGDAGWHSYADILPLNKAMPFWLEHDPDAEIAPLTQARALNAGWMWGIPVQERMGCGYVFSDAHLSPEAAQREVEAQLGRAITPRGVLSIDPGRLKQAWVHNCIAIGLAQSFLEPLEATSIHGSLVQILMLTKITLDKAMGPGAAHHRTRYNATVARQVDDFAQFINLHYAGGRRDTAFWQEMTATGLSDVTRARLAHWQSQPLLPTDFADFPYDLAHVEEQLYAPVLDGLALTSRVAANSVLADAPEARRAARKTLERLRREFSTASTSALGHRACLQAFHKSSTAQ